MLATITLAISRKEVLVLWNEEKYKEDATGDDIEVIDELLHKLPSLDFDI